MKQRQSNFLLGLTSILMIALFLATFFYLYPRQAPGGQWVTVHFRHEDGLAPIKPGSPVVLSDSITVGAVRVITIAQVDPPRGKGPQPLTVFSVLLEIDRNVPLCGNAQITTNQPAIGGAGYVSIVNVGTPDVPLTGPVMGLPPLSLSAAISTLSRRLLGEGGLVDQLNRAVDPNVENSLMHKLLISLDDVNAMTAELRTQMSPTDQHALLAKLHRILDDLNSATGAIRAELARGDSLAMLARVHTALSHLDEGLIEATAILRENRPVVRDTLTSVRHAAQFVDTELLARVRTELDPQNPTSTLGKVHVAMDRVNSSLADVKSMTSTGERMLMVSRPTIELILQNFQNMSDQLRLASQEVLLNPSKLIWGPKPEREEKLVVFRAATSFAEAASELDQAAARLQAILQTLPADGATSPAQADELKRIYDRVQTSFQRFGRAEDVLWEQLR